MHDGGGEDEDDGGSGDEDDGGGGDVAEDLDSKSFEVLTMQRVPAGRGGNAALAVLAEADMQRLPSWQRRTGSEMYR